MAIGDEILGTTPLGDPPSLIPASVEEFTGQREVSVVRPVNAQTAFIKIPRCTTIDNTLWSATSMIIIFEQEVFDGANWISGGSITIPGGIQMNKSGTEELTETSASFPIHGNPQQIRVRLTTAQTVKTGVGVEF